MRSRKRSTVAATARSAARKMRDSSHSSRGRLGGIESKPSSVASRLRSSCTRMRSIHALGTAQSSTAASTSCDPGARAASQISRAAGVDRPMLPRKSTAVSDACVRAAAMSAATLACTRPLTGSTTRRMPWCSTSSSHSASTPCAPSSVWDASISVRHATTMSGPETWSRMTALGLTP